jgi:putative hydrolase of the HAD superfamily
VISAVLFDGDQTLWDFQRVMRAALIAVLEELREARPGPFTRSLSWQDLEHDRAVIGEEYDGLEFNLSRLRVRAFALTLERRREAEGGDEDDDAFLSERLGASYFEHRDRDPALFSDTIACLDSLRPHYRLGLLSNGSRLPEKIGLGHYFETVVFAQDHRVAKPDKGIFEIVERELGVGPTSCVLVGDHLVNDVTGAKAAGWRAVWIDRDGDGTFVASEGSGLAPDAVVTSLGDLPAVLKALTG